MDYRPPDFERTIGEIGNALTRAGLSFMLIGGQAVLLHGRPRLTQDIDITLGADPDRVPEILEMCETLHLRPLPDEPEGFVQRTFVLPVARESTGVRVDFIFSNTVYERQAIGRAVQVELAGTRVAFASAEDLILHKLFAGRPRDLEDAAGVVRRKGRVLDWGYLEKWAEEFAAAPGREDLPDHLYKLRSEI